MWDAGVSGTRPRELAGSTPTGRPCSPSGDATGPHVLAGQRDGPTSGKAGVHPGAPPGPTHFTLPMANLQPWEGTGVPSSV